MIARVLRFVRLPLLLLLIFAAARFSLGVAGVPYAPRGNAMFSIVGLTFISSFYFGALSRRVGGFGAWSSHQTRRSWIAKQASSIRSSRVGIWSG